MLKLPSISINLRKAKDSLRVAPINRLPQEILILILTLRTSERDLIRATSVCKYWRNTLVSTPTLWNNIIFSERTDRDTISPPVRTYFERSGSIPVKVQIHARASRLLSPYTGRISQLTIFIDNRSDLGEITKHLSKPAPLIETVALYVTRRELRGLVLPPGFLEMLFSIVRTLTLYDAILSPGLLQFSKLTKFTLNARLASVTPTNLLDTLEQMPLLCLLEATFRSPQLRDVIPETRVVTLPHLEGITITVDENGRAPVSSPLLPALCLPNARSVYLRLIDIRGAPLDPILPLSFRERLPNLSVIGKASASLNMDEDCIVFRGLGNSELTIRTHSGVPFPFTRSAFGGLPFDGVHHLLVSFRSSPVDTLCFVRLLRFMKGLEYLKLIQDTVEALGRWIGEDDQAGICPALSTLIVISADLRAKGCVELLKQVRECAGVPIARVEVRHDRRYI